MDARTGEERSAKPSSAGQVWWAFVRLGLTSFGGPVAHLGYFRNEFVVRRKWLDERAYADLVFRFRAEQCSVLAPSYVASDALACRAAECPRHAGLFRTLSRALSFASCGLSCRPGAASVRARVRARVAGEAASYCVPSNRAKYNL